MKTQGLLQYNSQLLRNHSSNKKKGANAPFREKHTLKKRSLLVALLALLSFQLKAQPELTLPFMPTLFQSSYINPTLLPEHTFSLGLPGSSVFGQFITNGFIPDNVMNFRNDTMHIDLNSLVDDLRDNNMIFLGENVDIFHLRSRILNGYYWFAIRQNFTFTFNYPRDLINLAVNGNEQFIGTTLDLSSLRLNATLYNEYTFGMMKELPRWIFGGRLSILQGLSNIQFDPTRLTIDIESAMFGHYASADAQLRTAGIPKNGSGDPSFDHVGTGSWLSSYFSNFKNKGFALSGGVTYKYDEKTRLSFSFYDLGFINWKDSVQTYTLKGETTFNGLDIMSEFLNGNDVNIDSLLEKTTDEFKRDTVYTNYRTWLYPKFNFSANYQAARRTMVGFSISAMVNRKLYPALTLGVSQGVGRFFNIVGTASFNHRTFSNLGLGLMVKPGPFQLFVIADNTTPLRNPLKTTNMNIRVGLNIVVGRVNQPDGLPFR